MKIEIKLPPRLPLWSPNKQEIQSIQWKSYLEPFTRLYIVKTSSWFNFSLLSQFLGWRAKSKFSFLFFSFFIWCLAFGNGNIWASRGHNQFVTEAQRTQKASDILNKTQEYQLSVLRIVLDGESAHSDSHLNTFFLLLFFSHSYF